MRRKTSLKGDEFDFHPPGEVEDLFKLLMEGKTRDAEEALNKALEALSKYRERDGFQGYIKGLEGILLSLKEKERSTYLSGLNTHEALKKARKEFMKNMREELHAAYDKWYFKALLDYVDFLASSLPNLKDKG
ncbi:MAG: hypothetical protein ACP5QI_04805 [Candidatus Bathyarchaeia archaeon]